MYRLTNAVCYKSVNIPCRLQSVLMTRRYLWLLHVVTLVVLSLSDLLPSLYINNIARRVHQCANLILRCFVLHNVDLLVCAFVTYVRPLLEYNSSVWSSSLKRDNTLIEQLQRRFTKQLRSYQDLSCDECLKRLNVDTLELRRIKSNLVLCYKIIFWRCRSKYTRLFRLGHY